MKEDSRAITIPTKPLITLFALVAVAGVSVLAIPQLRMPVQLWKANAEYGRGDRETALSDYESVLEIDKNCTESLLKTGIILQEKGDVPHAAQYFKRLYHAANGKLPALEHLSALALSSRAYKAAERFANEWISLSPKNSRAFRALGNALARQGDTDAAIVAYNESLKIDPNSDAGRDRDQLLTHTRSIEDLAAGVFQPKLENRPGDFDANLRDAQRFYAAGDYDYAMQRLGVALKLRQDPSAAAMRASMEFSGHHYEQAAADFALAEKLGGNRKIDLNITTQEFQSMARMNSLPVALEAWEMRCLHGIALSNVKDYNGALKCFNNAISLRPDYGPAYAARADIYSVLRRDHDAIADREKAKKFGGISPHRDFVKETLESTITE